MKDQAELDKEITQVTPGEAREGGSEWWSAL